MTSFEIFPPKGELDLQVSKLAKDLTGFNPEFISVTYGANKSVADERTLEVSKVLKSKFNLRPLHHLTGIYFDDRTLKQYLDKLLESGIYDILALRGDLPSGVIPNFKYSKDLIKSIRNYSQKFNVFASCYPEGHAEDKNSYENIEFLEQKIENGATELITQLFFDNSKFYDLASKVKVPIHPGIMPLISPNQIQKIVFMCGASLPAKLVKIVYKHQDDIESFRKATFEYAKAQIEDLQNNGFNNIHLYTMNKIETVNFLFG